MTRILASLPHLTLAAFVIQFCACSSSNYSSDPTRDGLFGYLATGEEGYQSRILEREQKLDGERAALAKEESRTSKLGADLKQQQSRLANLSRELATLHRETEALAGRQLETDASLHSTRIMAEIADLRNQALTASTDTSLSASEKRRRADAIAPRYRELKTQLDKLR